MTAWFEAFVGADGGRRGALRWAAAMLLLPLLAAGCVRPEVAEPPPQPAVSPASYAKPQAEVAPPLPPQRIEHAQRMLATLGYHPGPADGVAGEHTEAAVRAFQDSAGLTVDGRLSAELITALERAQRVHEVMQVQRRLAALGHDPGEADGQPGPKTRAAIRRFEAAAGVAPTGKISPALLDLLAKAEASQVQWAGEESAPAAAAVAAAPKEPAAAGVEDRLSPAAGPVAGPIGDAAAEAGQAEPAALAPADEANGAAREATLIVATPGGEGATEGTDASKRIILPGDKVRLRLGEGENDIREFTVGLDGSLTLPNNVAVQAAGLTAKQLEDLVMVKLVEGYLMGLEVDVMPTPKSKDRLEDQKTPAEPASE